MGKIQVRNAYWIDFLSKVAVLIIMGRGSDDRSVGLEWLRWKMRSCWWKCEKKLSQPFASPFGMVWMEGILMLKVGRGFLGISSQCIVCAYQNNVFFTPLLLTLAAQKKKHCMFTSISVIVINDRQTIDQSDLMKWRPKHKNQKENQKSKVH